MSDMSVLPDQVTESAPATSPAPAPADNTDWKGKYNGLQGYVNQLKAALDKANGELVQTRTTYEGQVTELSQKAEKAMSDLAVFQTQATEYKTKYEQFQARESTRSVVKQYASENGVPMLLDLFDDGLLTGIEGLPEEDRVKKLNAAAEKIRKYGQDKVTSTLAGSVPPPPADGNPGNPTSTLAELNSRMEAAYKASGHNANDPAYRKAFDDYMDGIAKGLK